MLKPLVIAALALTAAPPATAQTVTSPSRTSKAKDPNRKICEVIERIGSRLAVDRVCMTAAQWEEQKRLQREHVEGVQRNVGQRPSN